jgi:hypothetical protein
MDLRELGALFKENGTSRAFANDVIEKIKIGRSILVAIEEARKADCLIRCTPRDLSKITRKA